MSSLISHAAACFATQSHQAPEARRVLIDALTADKSSLAQAWSLALRIQGATAGQGGVPTDTQPRLLGFVGADDETRVVASLAAKEAARAALLSFDLGRVRKFRAIQGTLAANLVSPGAVLGLELTDAWLSWCEGRYEPEPMMKAGPRARAAGLPGYVVEAKALEALHLLARGDVVAATSAARLASRMARAEGIPDSEVLANIVLARVRRFQDRPHLALLILAGLAPHAPPAWRGWMEWEAVFSGALSVRGVNADSLASALIQLVDATRRGDAEAARSLAPQLEERAAAAPFSSDARDAIALLIPGSRGSEAMAAWRRGEQDACPPGVAGIAFAGAESATDTACAHIVLREGSEATRLPAIAAGLAVVLWGADACPAAAPTRPRSDAGLAVLALAGAPIEVSLYFQEVYGFDFDNTVHASILTMHMQRMRERLGDAADIERVEGTLVLRARRALLLRDPRCEEPLTQRVLRIIATTGRRGAGDLAKELGVPLRTIQRALKELHAVDDVVLVKAGRSVGYQVEDTTFSEPTRSRKFEGALVVA